MRKVLSYLFAGLVASMLTSCIFDYGDGMENMSDDPVVVSFTLDVAKQTKADDGYDWGDTLPEDETIIGTSFENRIMVDDLKVLIYSKTGQFVAEVQRIAASEVTPGSGVYRFWGVLKDDSINSNVTFDFGSSYRFIVLANCGELTYDTNGVPAPEALLYKSNWTSYATTRSTIPMWGATEVVLNNAESQDLGDISLVRAMAKVVVKLSDELKSQGYSITDASLTKSYEVGYSMPTDWNLLTTETMSHTGAFRSYDVTDALLDNISLFESGESRRVVYVPEIQNFSEGVDNVRLNISLNDGKSERDFTGDQAIRFATYGADGLLPDSPSFYDIVRNHVYEYTITNVGSAGNELKLICEVQPWVPREETIDFTNEVSVSQTMTWSNVEYVNYETGEVILYNDTTIEATCTFQIDTPVGATWTSSLISIEGNTDAFSWVGNTKNGLVGTGQPSVIKFKVNRGTPLSPQHICKLRITLQTLDGRTIVVKNLVPDGKAYKEFTIIQNSI